jgi:16S rRNA processing protein RimM
MNAPASGDTVVVGRILGAWGVQGWVQVYSWTDPPESLFEYQPWYLGAGAAADVLRCKQWRRSGRKLVAELSEISSPEQAARLSEATIAVSRSQLPEPRPGEYYWHDLMGLEVLNLQGHCWGRVSGMLPTGAHDVLRVADEEGRIVLIPFVVDHFVRQVDLASGQVLVDWPEDWAS